MQLKPNALIERGKYRIIDALGHGGFGITYLAEQVMTKRKVCIKEFFPKGYYSREDDSSSVRISSQEFSENMERFKAKFIKEAQTIASLDHSNIIHIHDAFEENGTAYYVMEYVEGGSLRDIVKEQGPLSESDAKRYIRAVASALSYIHEQKINHLDVKPGNIMVRTKDDSAILIDFGLAKHYDIVGDQTSSTPVGISHGYAPIEQYTSGGVKEFSPSTDIYGLGATLYYLVTGEVPPHATDVGEEGLPKLPDHLSQCVRQAITKSMQYWRKDRPQSVKEFLKLLDDDKIVAPVAEATIINVETKLVDESTVIDVKPKQTPKPAPQPKNEPKPKNERKSKRGLWLGIFLFVLAAVASFILFGGGSSKEDAPKSAVATVDTLASSNDSLNLAKSGVDTLMLNDTPKEQPKEEPKEQPKPSEVNTETETKPEPPRNPGIRNETGSNFVSLSSNGGSGSIKYSIVNGNGSEVTYTNSGSSWLKSAKGAGKIEYNAGANTTGSERSATIKVMYANKSFEVVVTQPAAPVEFKLTSSSNITLSADGGSGTISYYINVADAGNKITAMVDDTWLTVENNNGVISYSASRNNTIEERSATIRLSYGGKIIKVNIVQNRDIFADCDSAIYFEELFESDGDYGNGKQALYYDSSQDLDRNDFGLSFEFYPQERNHEWQRENCVLAISRGYRIFVINICDGYVSITTNNHRYEYNTTVKYVMNAWNKLNIRFYHGTLYVNDNIIYNVELDRVNGDNYISCTNFSSGNKFRGMIRNLTIYKFN